MNPILVSTKWWSEQSATISNCLYFSGLSLPVDCGRSLSCWICLASWFTLLLPNKSNSAISCSLEQRSLPSNTSSALEIPDSLWTSGLWTNGVESGSELEPEVPIKLAAMLVKNPMAAFGRKKEVAPHRCFLQPSPAPLELSGSWT